ncbi:MAG: hypothetical protein CVU46_18180 [Chloroflexi bacterium HGW-Chloroflexi-8]|nr:MAG: hypothetical protein CVU46_18180 [Chloroflexi bacterium HGW-Chloroflexi-8]
MTNTPVTPTLTNTPQDPTATPQTPTLTPQNPTPTPLLETPITPTTVSTTEEPIKTPTSTEVVQTLPPPVQLDTPSVLIPVTGADYSMKTSTSHLQKASFNFGLAFLGIGMVLQGIRKRLES